LTVEYDGTQFAGWAKQPGKRTVEHELERALQQILGRPTHMIVGGRTDAGVHASAQIVAYDGEALAPYNLNALLPSDVAIVSSTPARPGFDPRNEAVSRTYRYRIWHSRQRTVARRHDTLQWGRALNPTETLHHWFRRTVDRAAWGYEDGEPGTGEPIERASGRLPILQFEITADSFLRHMNRALIGTMLDVGLGMRTVDEFSALLRGAPRDAGGWTAPPTGLTLESVNFPGEPRL